MTPILRHSEASSVTPSQISRKWEKVFFFGLGAQPVGDSEWAKEKDLWSPCGVSTCYWHSNYGHRDRMTFAAQARAPKLTQNEQVQKKINLTIVGLQGLTAIFILLHLRWTVKKNFSESLRLPITWRSESQISRKLDSFYNSRLPILYLKISNHTWNWNCQDRVPTVQLLWLRVSKRKPWGLRTNG